MRRCLALALCCLLLTGCGGKTAVDPAVLGPALLEGAGFPEGMLELDSEMAGRIFQLDMTAVTACYAAVSGTAGSDELLLLTAGSKEQAGEICDLLTDRIAYRRESFGDYLPDEAEKLDQAILIRQDCTVIFCVCPDAEAAQAIIDG